jgi:hypothetical protein
MFRQSTKKLLNFSTLSDYDFFITFIDEYCEMFWMGKLSIWVLLVYLFIADKVDVRIVFVNIKRFRRYPCYSQDLQSIETNSSYI